jgi:UDP-GlcNAc:undecaprenyl-phosphate/decaprenyl-phosphate GlcNAc-1-phosphate transferase
MEITYLLNIDLYFFCFFTSFVICMLIKKNFVHKINTKQSEVKVQNIHGVPISRLGGLGVFLTIILFWFINKFNDPSYLTNIYSLLLLSSLPTFLVGLIDDIFDKAPPLTRLITTFLTSIISVFIILTVNKSGNSLNVFFLFEVLFVVLLITFLPHMFNLIDGINGLCSSCGIIILLTIFIVFEDKIIDETSAFIFLMILSIIPFLILNTFTSKLFLGDCGSYLIGFVCSFITSLHILNDESFYSYHAVLILFYPIFETTFTCYRRLTNGSKIFKADRNHLHSNIYNLIKTKYPNRAYLQTLCFLFLIPLILLGPIIFYYNNDNPNSCIISLLLLSCLYFFIFNYFTRKEI